MDYRNYKDLMERYQKLSKFTPDRNEIYDGLIKKLMDISYKKFDRNNVCHCVKETSITGFRDLGITVKVGDGFSHRLPLFRFRAIIMIDGGIDLANSH